MRLKNIPGSREEIAKSKYAIKEETPEDELRGRDWAVKGNWAHIFGNKNPVRTEIGMGKGLFLTEQARLNPDVNFVGIEKYSSVLLRAVQKQEADPLPNIRFIRMEAKYIENVFAPDETECIYLNFSDPWPKKKNAKRRLTSRRFLDRYLNILPAGGFVEFKTDNIPLFDFSLAELWQSGAVFSQDALSGACPLPDEFSYPQAPGLREESWRVLAATRDLHNSPLNEGNVMTEYEIRFSEAGSKICKYIIEKIH